MIKRLVSNPNFTPTIISIIVILMSALIYFHPLLSGKTLQSSDVILVTGMQKNIEEYRETHSGEDALWSTSMFSGMPAYTIHVDYKGNILLPLQRGIAKALPNPIGFFVIGMLSFFWLLRTTKVDVWLSLAGALGFGFFSYHVIITEAGHGAKLMALMYCPAVLASIATVFNGKKILGSALLILTLGLELLTSHVQITYYLIFIVVSYGAFELYKHIRSRQLKNFGIGIGLMSVAAAIAFFLNSSSLAPLQEYNHYSIRGTSELKVEPEEKENPGKISSGKKSTGVDKDYAFNWSNGRDELLTLIMANAKGGSSGYKLDKKSNLAEAFGEDVVANGIPTYWGTQPFTSGPTYAGVVICFLFIMALFIVKSPIKWALFFATVLFMFLSLGKNSYNIPSFIIILAIPIIYNFTYKSIKLPPNAYALILAAIGFILVINIGGNPETDYRLTDLFFDKLPFYNKFRAPASILGMVAVTMPWLALLGAQEIFNSKISKKEKLEAIIYSLGISIFLLVFFGLMGSNLYDFKSISDKQFPAQALDALHKDRESLLTTDAWRGIFFIIITAGILLAFTLEKIKNNAIVGGILALIIGFDLLTVDARYLWKNEYKDKEDYAENFTPSEADQFIVNSFPKNKSHYRVFPASRNAFNDGKTPYTLNSIGGYNAAKIKRYQQLIEAQIGKFNFRVINMLNTEFIIFNKELPPGFTPIYQSKGADKEIVFKNENNFGPAWITPFIKQANTPDEALYGLDSLDTYNNSLVEKLDGKYPTGFSTDSVDRMNEKINLKSWDNKKLIYEFNSSKSRFVVFSEIYYPKGWTAKIDGKESPIYQTNFVLRGMVIPSGKHTIEFNYSPEVLEKSSNISRICSVILLLALFGAAFYEIRLASFVEDSEPDNTLSKSKKYIGKK